MWRPIGFDTRGTITTIVATCPCEFWTGSYSGGSGEKLKTLRRGEKYVIPVAIANSHAWLVKRA